MLPTVMAERPVRARRGSAPYCSILPARCGARYSNLRHDVNLRQGQCELRWQYLAEAPGWPPAIIVKVAFGLRGKGRACHA